MNNASITSMSILPSTSLDDSSFPSLLAARLTLHHQRQSLQHQRHGEQLRQLHGLEPDALPLLAAFQHGGGMSATAVTSAARALVGDVDPTGMIHINTTPSNDTPLSLQMAATNAQTMAAAALLNLPISSTLPHSHLLALPSEVVASPFLTPPCSSATVVGGSAVSPSHQHRASIGRSSSPKASLHNRRTSMPAKFEDPHNVIKEQHRRMSHNEIEKRRRDKITETIMQLGDYLPEEGGDEGGVALHTRVSARSQCTPTRCAEQGLHSRQGARLHRGHGRRECRAQAASRRRRSEVRSASCVLDMDDGCRRKVELLTEENTALKARLTDASSCPSCASSSRACKSSTTTNGDCPTATKRARIDD